MFTMTVPDTAHEWTSSALCNTGDPDELFARGAAQNLAKVVCRACPVRMECLADALDNRVEYGVWGGMTERERRALLRRRPDVSSWRRLFEQARDGIVRPRTPSGDQVPARR
jgi:WhiB family redox-sensing transcriptional regulator